MVLNQAVDVSIIDDDILEAPEFFEGRLLLPDLNPDPVNLSPDVAQVTIAEPPDFNPDGERVVSELHIGIWSTEHCIN